MSKSVAVTMFFNLKNLRDANPQTRTPEFYLEKGKGTLSVQSPMIIFCDWITKDLIKPLRESLVDTKLYPTVYIEKNISEYELYKDNWRIIANNRSWNKRPSDRNTPSYLLTMTFKFMALKIAMERNDFNGTHYFWIDFGISHLVHGSDMLADVHSAFANPRPKVSVMYIHYRNEEQINKMKLICDEGFCGMANAFFSVEATTICKLYTLAMSIFYEMLFIETGHNDEQIMSYCYVRHPELFTLYYGDYYSVISNYNFVKKDWHCVRYYFVHKAMEANRPDLAKAAAQACMEGLKRNFFTIDESCNEDKEYLWKIANME